MLNFMDRIKAPRVVPELTGRTLVHVASASAVLGRGSLVGGSGLRCRRVASRALYMEKKCIVDVLATRKPQKELLPLFSCWLQLGPWVVPGSLDLLIS